MGGGESSSAKRARQEQMRELERQRAEAQAQSERLASENAATVQSLRRRQMGRMSLISDFDALGTRSGGLGGNG